MGGDLEKPICRGRLPKKGALEPFVDLRGGLARKRRVDTPTPTMIVLSHLQLSRIDLPKLNSSN